ncbi:hypothetical protein GCM10010182_82270 [Actinomadura cremea]|nr:hypothetical protein GCM10010182_82270 [Actinomadura cremea]
MDVHASMAAVISRVRDTARHHAVGLRSQISLRPPANGCVRIRAVRSAWRAHLAPVGAERPGRVVRSVVRVWVAPAVRRLSGRVVRSDWSRA